MIIVHIITNLATGGAELMLERLVRHQSAEGRHEHRVISLQGLGQVGPRLQAAGIPVETMGITGPVELVTGFVKLVRTLARTRPDIVQTWMYHSDLIGGIAARLAGLRRILWGVRVMDISPELGLSRSVMLSRRICARLSRAVPRRIVYVAKSARKVHEPLGYDPAKSVVIPNGYSVPAAEASAGARCRVRAGLGLSDEHILIGSAGRFSPQKGYRGFVAAAKEIASQSPRSALPAARPGGGVGE